MGHVANRADVDRGLSRDDLGVQRRDRVDVEVVEGLLGQLGLAQHLRLLISDDFLLREALGHIRLLRGRLRGGGR